MLSLKRDNTMVLATIGSLRMSPERLNISVIEAGRAVLATVSLLLFQSLEHFKQLPVLRGQSGGQFTFQFGIFDFQS